jgi:excisionase family DNA binding protein
MSDLTRHEVAALLHCSPTTAGKLLRSGLIEAYKPAGKWLATPEAVDAYKASTSNRAPARRRRRRT